MRRYFCIPLPSLPDAHQTYGTLMLWIALDFPRLPLDTFALPSAHTKPWVIADGLDVLVCNEQARELGVREGMRLSAACALSPQLNYRLRDAAAETATLTTLAA